MTAHEDWVRLGDYVRKRRTELRMTQAGVQEVGGPSAAKVREIENRRTTTLSASKRRDLERALKWTDDSVDAILRGDEPGLKQWRNEGVGLAGLIPTEQDNDNHQWPSELPAKVTGMYRSARDAVDAMNRGDESDLVVSVTVAAVLASDIMHGLGRTTDRTAIEGESDDVEEEPTVEGSTSEEDAREKTRGGGSPPLADDSQEGPLLGADEDLPGLREETEQQRRQV